MKLGDSNALIQCILVTMNRCADDVDTKMWIFLRKLNIFVDHPTVIKCLEYLSNFNYFC